LKQKTDANLVLLEYTVAFERKGSENHLVEQTSAWSTWKVPAVADIYFQAD